MHYKFVLGASLAAMALCCSVLGQQDGVVQDPAGSNVATDVEKAFTWFDTLGFPRLADRKFVHVATKRVKIQETVTAVHP